MKKVIYKYSFSSRDVPELLLNPIGSPFKIKMVKDAIILSVREQNEVNEQRIVQSTGKIWVLCDANQEEKEERQFMLIETGMKFEMSSSTIYIGTYQLYGGKIILHLFEILTPIK